MLCCSDAALGFGSCVLQFGPTALLGLSSCPCRCRSIVLVVNSAVGLRHHLLDAHAIQLAGSALHLEPAGGCYGSGDYKAELEAQLAIPGLAKFGVSSIEG